jgi:hypothetical protein
VVVGLLFFSTVTNYISRQTFSVFRHLVFLRQSEAEATLLGQLFSKVVWQSPSLIKLEKSGFPGKTAVSGTFSFTLSAQIAKYPPVAHP